MSRLNCGKGSSNAQAMPWAASRVALPALNLLWDMRVLRMIWHYSGAFSGTQIYLQTNSSDEYKQGEVTPIDSVQTPENGVKQSKPKIWKVKRSKAHCKLEKVKGQAS